MRREWSDSRDALEDLLGHPVTVASVPGGYFSAAVANAAADAGLRVLFTSEPTTKVSSHEDCTVIGRFTIRRGHAPDMAQRFVARRAMGTLRRVGGLERESDREAPARTVVFAYRGLAARHTDIHQPWLVVKGLSSRGWRSC